MALSADLLRGYTDTIILKQLSDGDSYGYRISKAVAEQSGARRRYYSLTDVGLEKLLKDCEAWRETRQVLDQLLGGEQK